MHIPAHSWGEALLLHYVLFALINQQVVRITLYFRTAHGVYSALREYLCAVGFKLEYTGRCVNRGLDSDEARHYDRYWTFWREKPATDSNLAAAKRLQGAVLACAEHLDTHGAVPSRCGV